MPVLFAPQWWQVRGWLAGQRVLSQILLHLAPLVQPIQSLRKLLPQGR